MARVLEHHDAMRRCRSNGNVKSSLIAMNPIVIYLLMFASVAGMFLLSAALISFAGRRAEPASPPKAETRSTPATGLQAAG
ncbi:hypothetical protein [Roseivivax sp. CAU 1761]